MMRHETIGDKLSGKDADAVNIDASPDHLPALPGDGCMNLTLSTTPKSDTLDFYQGQLVLLWRNRRCFRSFHPAGYRADVRYLLSRCLAARKEDQR